MSLIWQVSEGILRDGDVLLAVDGSPIAPDGTVMLPEAPSLRLGMRHRVQRMPLGTVLEYLVLRDGERMVVHVPTSPRKLRLLPPRLPVPRPAWLVLGGLVFCPLLPDYEALVPKCALIAIDGHLIAIDGHLIAIDGHLIAIDGHLIAIDGHLIAPVRIRTNGLMASLISYGIVHMSASNELLMVSLIRCQLQRIHALIASDDLPHQL
jgi:uncharacterized Zn-binding protein involved in type VI secretion